MSVFRNILISSILLSGCASYQPYVSRDYDCTKLGTLDTKNIESYFLETSPAALAIMGKTVYLCAQCEERLIGGAIEERVIRSANEKRKIGESTENRTLRRATEERALGAADETRAIGATSEQRLANGAQERRGYQGSTEDRLQGASVETREYGGCIEKLKCVVDPSCRGYRLTGLLNHSRITLQEFDGRTLTLLDDNCFK